MNIYLLICFAIVLCNIPDCQRNCIHGKCIKDECICNSCYIGQGCYYKQSKIWVAFMWEFILPIGAGHLYIGNYLTGFIKLILMVATLCYPYCYTIYSVRNAIHEEDQYVMMTDVGINVISFKARIIKSKSLLLLIYFLDLILISAGFYRDGNGIELC
jgi:hypothetical protein